MFAFLGATMHQSDIDNDKERNIYNYSQDLDVAWNSSRWQNVELNTTNITMEESYKNRFRNVLYKTVDLVGYSMIQIIKVSIEFGYEKAYNYKPESFIYIAKLIFIIVIIGFIIPIIVPILAIIYLLFEGLKWIIKRFKNGKI